jgi:hypothetical protein
LTVPGIRVETLPLRIFKRMCQVASLAIQIGQFDAAGSILAALRGVRPKEPTLWIHEALLLVEQGRLEEARDALVDLYRVHPDYGYGKGLLGYTLFALKEHGWEKFLQDLIDDGSDADAVAMARHILSEEREVVVGGANGYRGDVQSHLFPDLEAETPQPEEDPGQIRQYFSRV